MNNEYLNYLKKPLSFFLILVFLVVTFLGGNFKLLNVKAADTAYSQSNPEIIITNISNTSPTVSEANALGVKSSKQVYECVVLYNNSNIPLNFGDYSLRINGSNNSFCDIKGDYVVAPKDYLIVWMQGDNYLDLVNKPGIAQFKSAWGISNVPDNKIAVVNENFQGFSDTKSTSSSTVKVEVMNDNGLLVSSATVSLPAKAGSSVKASYCFKAASANTRTLKYDKYISKNYKPGTKTWDYSNTSTSNAQYLAVFPDTQAPQISNVSYPSSITNEESVSINATITDDFSVTTAGIYYSLDNGPYIYKNLSNIFSKYISPLNPAFSAKLEEYEVFGAKTIKFYIVGKDQKNTVRYPQNGEISIAIKPKTGATFNIENGQYINGKQFISAKVNNVNSNKELKVDGQVIGNTFNTFFNAPILSLRVDGLNNFYLNKVLSNNTQIYDLANNSFREYTYSMLVPQSTFADSANFKSITIAAGLKTDDDTKGDFTPEKADFDNFNVRDIHLTLPDGTRLEPSYAAEGFDYNKNVITLPYSSKQYYIGKSSTTGSRPYAQSTDFKFNLPKDKLDALGCVFDSTKYESGKHKIEYYEDGKLIYSAEIYVDNFSPYITTNINDGQTFTSSQDINVDANDNQSGINSLSVKLDEEEIEVPFSLNSTRLESGKHTLNVSCTDKAGNQLEKQITFYLENNRSDFLNNSEFDILNNTNKFVFTHYDDQTKFNIVKATNVDVTSKTAVIEQGQNTWTIAQSSLGADQKPISNENLNSSAVWEKLKNEDGDAVETFSNKGIPYQKYTIDVSTVAETLNKFVLNWVGYAQKNNSVEIYAKDVKSNNWSLVGKGHGSDIIKLNPLLERAKYEKDGKIEIAIQGSLVDSTRKDTSYYIKKHTVDDTFTIGWMTDTQNHSESNSGVYNSITGYLADQYKSNNIQYAIHSGDIVNNAYVNSWWDVANTAFKKLDDAGMPYGVLAGNHDINFSDIDASNYSNYFGTGRFEGKAWFGESYKDNFMHYDLISPKGHDMVVFYISYKPILTVEMQNWLNEKLSRFKDRDAIIVCHEYMGNVPLEKTATASSLLTNVIAKNKNVRMVLNGHHEGENAFQQTVVNYTDGTKGKIYEMFYNFQFSSKDKEGHVRLLTFSNGKMFWKTYSTVNNQYLTDEKDQNSVPFVLNDGRRVFGTDKLSLAFIDENPIEAEVVKTNNSSTNVADLDVTYTAGQIQDLNSTAKYNEGYLCRATKASGYTYFSNVALPVENRKPFISASAFEVAVWGTNINPLDGVKATDFEDKDLSTSITCDKVIDGKSLGYQKIKYSVKDLDGNTCDFVKRYGIIDVKPPVFQNLNAISVGNSHLQQLMEGFQAIDECDGDVTSTVTTSGNYVANKPGKYLIEYSASDSSGNVATAYREVTLFDDTLPVITGKTSVNVNVKFKVTLKNYATATDDVDGNITSKIKYSGTVNTKKIGKYVVRYSVSDANNNASTLNVTFNVVDKVKPTLKTPKSIAAKKKVKINLLSKVSVKDNYDKKVSKKLKVYVNNKLVKAPKKYVFKKKGKYSVKYEVQDASKNKVFKKITAKIK